MEPMKINQLLDKYFEAQTNTAEEAELKAYFSGQKVAQEHLPYQPLFVHFAEQKKMEAPEWKPQRAGKVRALYRWVSVAAAVVLVAGVSWQQYQTARQQKAEIAYHQAKDALNLLSAHFNDGAKEMQHLQSFEKAVNKIFE